jgi:hypothetical protein
MTNEEIVLKIKEYALDYWVTDEMWQEMIKTIKLDK